MKPAPGETSPDGRWSWDGARWVPIGAVRPSGPRFGVLARDLVLHVFVVPFIGLVMLAGLIVLGLILFGRQ